MTSPINNATSRRRLLQFLAASPLFAGSAMAEEGFKIPQRLPDPFVWAPYGIDKPIGSPSEALDIFDFEPVAFQNVPPAHFGYMATGADDEYTLRANRSDFGKFSLRPRRLRNVSQANIGIELFGMKWDSPIFICPTGFNKAFHPDGEVAVSKAAAAGKHLQFLSSAASTPIEEAMKARGNSPVCFQLYAPNDFELAKATIARAERAGAPILAITVDGVASRKNPTLERMRRLDTRTCTDCHETARGGSTMASMPNFSHIDRKVIKNVRTSGATLEWEYVQRLRDTTKMKVIIKGIVAPEDAALCVQHGFDGVLLSNHGGRNDDTGTSTIGILPEVVAAVNGKIPVLIDSGFRRGMDVVKALAMGATAIGIGRPYLWGLGAFGQEGVEGVLNILRTETRVAMAQAGAASVKELVPEMIRKS